MKKTNLLIGLPLLVLACAGPGKRTNLHEYTLAGQTLSIAHQYCAPLIRKNGFNINVEGIKIPNKSTENPFKFTVSKMSYKMDTLRTIKNSIKRYDGLMQASCSTIINLKKEKDSLKYLMYRNKQFQVFITYLENLDKAKSEKEVLQLAKVAFENANKLESEFENKIKQTQ